MLAKAPSLEPDAFDARDPLEATYALRFADAEIRPKNAYPKPMLSTPLRLTSVDGWIPGGLGGLVILVVLSAGSQVMIRDRNMSDTGKRDERQVC